MDIVCYWFVLFFVIVMIGFIYRLFCFKCGLGFVVVCDNWEVVCLVGVDLFWIKFFVYLFVVFVMGLIGVLIYV